jgi:hypothetical protein
MDNLAALFEASERRAQAAERLTQLADIYCVGTCRAPEELCLFAADDEALFVVETVFAASPFLVFRSGAEAAARQALEADVARRLLVVANASKLLVANIGTLRAAFTGLEARMGFISGRSSDEIVFALHKALAEPAAGLEGCDVFDAVEHSSNVGAADVEDLRRRLTHSTQIKIFRTHGEGSHAKLPGLTVCGLLGSVEFPEAPEIGCERASLRCKRQPHLPGNRVIFGDEIRAQAVFFLCCNGFNFAVELYPSPVSISLSLTEGCVAAVVAPIRAISVPDTLLVWLQMRIAAGGRIGDIVAALNDRCSALNQGRPFVLHGDPGLTFPATETPIEKTTLVDTEEIEAVRSWLVRLRTQVERTERILASLDAAAPQVNATGVAQILRSLRKLTLFAFKRSESVIGEWDAVGLRRDLAMLKLLVQRADVEICRTVIEARPYVDPFDLFHYDQLLTGSQMGPPCDQCGTRTMQVVYCDEPSEMRHGLTCDVCGPKAEWRVCGLQPELDYCVTRIGGAYSLKFRLMPASLTPIVPTASVALRFFDKARDHCIANFNEVVAMDTSEAWREILLPDDLSPDLHSVRVVMCSGLDPAYRRFRVLGGPPLWSASERVSHE